MIHSTTPGRMVDTQFPVKKFGRVSEIVPLPNLVEMQTKAFDEFLAPKVAAAARENQGLEQLRGDTARRVLVERQHGPTSA